MAKLKRKDLKHDKFVEGVGHQVEYFGEHRKTIVGAAVGVLALILGLVWFVGHRRTVAEDSRVGLQNAVRLFQGEVTTEQRPGFITFATTGERQRRVTEAFDKVKVDFSGSDVAGAAEYYLGLVDIEQNEMEAAEQKLRTAVKSGGKQYGSLARLALADLLAGRGDLAAARPEYEELIRNPSVVVPAPRAKLQLAKQLVTADPEAARPLLQELVAEGGPVSFAASAELRKLSGA